MNIIDWRGVHTNGIVQEMDNLSIIKLFPYLTWLTA
jgi:hypothetical protein